MGKEDQNDKIQYVQLPRDLPEKGEEKVIFVLSDNDRLEWSMHDGVENNFQRHVSWQTPPVKQDELDLDPCQSLFTYAAPQALQFLFGSAQEEAVTKQTVLALMKTRGTPSVSVYILSVGDQANDTDLQKNARKREEGIEYLFRDYPCRLFKFRNTDFFKPEQNVCSSMTIDKVASMYGAWKEHGVPLLLLHTGHTIWYSAIGADSKLLGEGISPGFGIRFQSLNDYCRGEFPMIESEEFLESITQAAAYSKPLPMFGTDVKTSMIANISSEMYGQLRNIIKQFESKVLHDVDPKDGRKVPDLKDVIILITGRDMKLTKKLLVDGPKIVDIESGVTPPKTDPRNYCVRKSLHFAGMQKLLSEHAGTEKPPSPDEELRSSIIGLRVAKALLSPNGLALASDVVRGTVGRISRGNKLEDDLYSITYDDGEKKWLSQVHFFDGLRLYLEYGEEKADEESTWAKEKGENAKTVREELVSKSAKADKRDKDLDEAIDKGKTLVSLVGTPSTEKRPAKKQAKSSSAKKARIELKPQEYVGKRAAKYFGEDLYFGTIDYVSDDDKGSPLWHIQYDDDDQEDFEYNQLREAIILYDEKKHEDPRLEKAGKKS